MTNEPDTLETMIRARLAQIDTSVARDAAALLDEFLAEDQRVSDSR